MKDLTGQRFGRLVAIEPTDRRVNQLVVWRCRCDCGREVEVVGTSLTKGNTRSCGCLFADSRARDITGQRFGRLVALEPTAERVRGAVVWRCRCDCGEECTATSSMLTSGNKRSCGCLRRESSAKDLAGQRFGRLVAERPVGRRNRSVLWRCQCDCGNAAYVASSQLTSGKTRSCGCLRKGGAAARRPSRRNLAGRRFGAVVAVDPTGALDGESPVWRCLCDCGRVVEIPERVLETRAPFPCEHEPQEA